MAASTTSKFTTKSSAPKSKVKPTVVQPAEHIQAEAVQSTAYSRMQRDFDELGIKLPSGTRTMISLVATFLTSFAATWIGLQAAEWMALGALVYTGSAFIGFMVLVIGYALALYVAYRAAMAVGRFVIEFNVEAVTDTAASIKDTAQRKVSLVRGWFTRSNELVRARVNAAI